MGLSQLGAPVALVGVVGEDPEGARVLLRAARDGIDITAVVPRGRTALLMDIVDERGSRRLLEDIPEESLVTVEDLEQAHAVLNKADTVSIQLQQPSATVLAAANAGRRRRARVVVDGAPDPGIHDELLAVVDVLRADADERTAGRLASAAASSTVERLGGRPELRCIDGRRRRPCPAGARLGERATGWRADDVVRSRRPPFTTGAR